MRLLLADALATIAPEVLPAVSADRTAWINACCARFFAVGKWAGTTTKWRGTDVMTNFAIFDDAFGGRYMTLPRNLLAVLGASHGDQAGAPRCRFSADRIRGPWYEFSSDGWGAGDAVGGSGLQDAGDGWTCFRDITEDSLLRVKTEVAETDPTQVLFRGLDENDEPIYTGAGASSYEGVKLNIGSALTTTTTQIFSAIPTLIQKPVTNGPIRLYAVSVADATETLIGMYDPGDKSPGFRRYRLACQPDHTTVHALCKRRHVPAVADADEIIPGNVNAIELGLHGRRYDLMNDPDTAAKYWMDAFALLNAELGEFNGAAAPRLQIERRTQWGRIPKVT